MAAAAREALGDYGERLTLVHADLLQLDLPEQVDAAFSNAVFHWIWDHVRCWLEEKVVEPHDAREYIAVVGLSAHHELLPPQLREPFTDAVLAHLELPLILRYVRLNIEARAST